MTNSICTTVNDISHTLPYSYLVKIIHKHLAHLVDWNCSIDGTI